MTDALIGGKNAAIENDQPVDFWAHFCPLACPASIGTTLGIVFTPLPTV
jgi:hypothetical protein